MVSVRMEQSFEFADHQRLFWIQVNEQVTICADHHKILGLSQPRLISISKLGSVMYLQHPYTISFEHGLVVYFTHCTNPVCERHCLIPQSAITRATIARVLNRFTFQGTAKPCHHTGNRKLVTALQ